MLKMDFQRRLKSNSRILRTIPAKSGAPFCLSAMNTRAATVGVNEPSWRRKIFSLSRQAKCVPLCSDTKHQLLAIHSTWGNVANLLQTFRTKIFLSLSDDFSQRLRVKCAARRKSARQLQHLESGHIRESAISRASRWLTKPTSAHPRRKQQRDYRFDMKTFTELKNAQSSLWLTTGSIRCSDVLLSQALSQ